MLFVLILILVACLYIFLLFFLSINSSLMNLCSNIFPVLFLHAMHVSWKTWTFGISVFVARPKKLSMWQCSQPHHAIQLDTWTTSSDFDWLVWWLFVVFVISLIALIAWTIWFCLLLCVVGAITIGGVFHGMWNMMMCIQITCLYVMLRWVI